MLIQTDTVKCSVTLQVSTVPDCDAGLTSCNARSLSRAVGALTVRSRSANSRGKYCFVSKCMCSYQPSRSAPGEFTVGENILCISMQLFIVTLTVRLRSANSRGKYCFVYVFVHSNPLDPLTVSSRLAHDQGKYCYFNASFHNNTHGSLTVSTRSAHCQKQYFFVIKRSCS